MKLKTKIASVIAAVAITSSLAIAPAANATWSTTVGNVGSQAFVVQTMSGGVRTLYPGQSLASVGYYAQPSLSCFAVNGVKNCNTGTWTKWVWLGDGYKGIKRVPNFWGY